MVGPGIPSAHTFTSKARETKRSTLPLIFVYDIHTLAIASFHFSYTITSPDFSHRIIYDSVFTRNSKVYTLPSTDMDCPECSDSLSVDYDSMVDGFTDYHFYKSYVADCDEHGGFSVVRVHHSDPHSAEMMWVGEAIGECEMYEGCDGDVVGSIGDWDRNREALCERCFYLPDEILEEVR